MTESEALTALVVLLGTWLFWPLILVAVILSGFVVISAGMFIYGAIVDAWNALTRRMRGKARPSRTPDALARVITRERAHQRTMKDRRVNR